MVVYLPEKDYELPDLDLLSLLFDSPISLSSEDTILHAEAADASNHLTKAQTRATVQRLAYILRHDFGIGQSGPGKDVVVCISSGQILLPAVFYSVIAAGGVYSAASSALNHLELARQIQDGQAGVIVASPDCIETALQAAQRCGIPTSRVLQLESNAHKRCLTEMQTQHNYLLQDPSPGQLQPWDRITDRLELTTRPICLLYSSGTTGIPKGVMLSHRNLVSAAMVPVLMERNWVQQQQKKDPSFTFQSRTLGHLPAAHIAGCQGYFVMPALSGGTVFWMPKFDLPRFLEYSDKHRISTFFSVPPIYLLLSQSPLVKNQFRNMVHAYSGAAPLAPALQAAAEAKLGCPITQTWGLSETTGGVTMYSWDQTDATGSVGPLMPNMRLRIVDEEGKDVDDEGEAGEFLIQGPSVAAAYWKNEEATRASFTEDGWMKTGDIGLRRDGLLYIVDRKKELIKYKGLQVAPAEIESLLLSHPHVLDVAVIGIPDPSGSGNELPRAYVVAHRTQISAEEIQGFVQQNLASHKRLRGGVVFVDAIPKSGSGKILRRVLRDMQKKEGRLSKL